MSNEKKVCGKYPIEAVADKVVKFAKVYKGITNEMPEFPMVQYVILAFGKNIDTTDKQQVIQFLEDVMDNSRQIANNVFEKLKSNTQDIKQ